MNKNTNNKYNFREEISEKFIKALEEDPIKFIKGWNFSETGIPTNGSTSKEYKGINKLYLKIAERENGYGDNRWLTFKQIKDNRYNLQKGAKGVKVEYYIPYDNQSKKWVTWDEYKKGQNVKLENGKEKYTLKQKLYTVFNASLIDGIKKKEIPYTLNDIGEEKVINTLSESMGVPIKESQNSASAYYNISEDYINLPEKGQFKTQADYIATALHELGHATGHKERLNREQSGRFGSKEYAYEELVAEITSSFMSEYVKEPLTDEILNNHKAYIQSWAGQIKENKNFLFKAIKDAEIASDYMVEKAHLQELKTEFSTINKPIRPSFLVMNDEGVRVEAEDTTPSFKLETDIAEKIGTYAATNGISRLDPLQQNATNGTVEDLKALYIEAKKKENEFSFSKDKDQEMEF